jgi:hypothetical protein
MIISSEFGIKIIQNALLLETIKKLEISFYLNLIYSFHV